VCQPYLRSTPTAAPAPPAVSPPLRPGRPRAWTRACCHGGDSNRWKVTSTAGSHNWSPSFEITRRLSAGSALAAAGLERVKSGEPENFVMPAGVLPDMGPIQEAHVAEPGLLVVEVAAADDATAFAFQAAIAGEVGDRSGRQDHPGSGPARRTTSGLRRSAPGSLPARRTVRGHPLNRPLQQSSQRVPAGTRSRWCSATRPGTTSGSPRMLSGCVAETLHFGWRVCSRSGGVCVGLLQDLQAGELATPGGPGLSGVFGAGGSEPWRHERGARGPDDVPCAEGQVPHVVTDAEGPHKHGLEDPLQLHGHQGQR
jgi:hypothetical protein